MTATLQQENQGRFTPTSLPAGDVIEYVPVEAIIRSASSWALLRAEYEAQMSGRAKGAKGPNFKTWLSHHADRDGSTITTEEIAQAAASADAVPQDLERLMKTLEAISADDPRRRSRSI